MDIQPFRRAERGGVADHVLEDLRNHILDGRIERGAKLPTERELAAAYGVSGGTIREAVRALAAMQLVEVRHGSGGYVTADVEQMVALALHAVIQIERIGVLEVLGVLGVLNPHAAELAAERATESDLTVLHEALERMKKGSHVDDIVGGLTDFLYGLASASHNPLLAAICKFLDGLQVALTGDLCRGSFATWRKTAGQLDSERDDLVSAIVARNGAKAREAARTYHRRAIEVIMALPNASAARVADPQLSKALALLMRRM